MSKFAGSAIVVVTLSTFLFIVEGGAATVDGYYHERSVKGVASSPWHEFYEWNAFCSPTGAITNQVCRTGTCPTLTHNGHYNFTSVPTGPATIYCDQPNFFAAPKVNQINVTGSTYYVDTAPNTDYFMAFGTNSSSWGTNPWDWHTGIWYQTFVATGTGINRVSFKLAASATTVQVKVLESNGGAINTWPQIGDTRNIDAGCSGCDVWVSWPHGNVQTTPGQTYAVSFQHIGGDGSMGFYVHRDSVGTGYSSGTAYKGTSPQTEDLYACVFSDNDGTVLTYQMESSNIGTSTEWAGAWAQSFTANGTSLAAVGLFAQDPSDAQWEADVLIFDGISGNTAGPQIGPTKRIGEAGWYGPGTGFGGMAYNPGEVPLTPGNTYLVVISPYDVDFGGFNPLRRPGGNVYPGGTAYVGTGGTWGIRSYDLSMTIMEYGDGGGPVDTPTPTPTFPPASSGIIEDYEDPFVGGINQDWSAWDDGWGSGIDQYASQPGVTGSAQGIRVYNGSGGTFRRNIPVNPGEQYYLTVWIKTLNGAQSGGAPSSVWAEWGYDLLNRDFATLGNNPAITWWDTAAKTPGSLASTSWQQFTSPTFTASGSFISTWTKAGGSSDAQGVYMFLDDWELVSLTEATPTPTNSPPPPPTATNTPQATATPEFTPDIQTGIRLGGWEVYR
jgi:hypothetical protein